METLKVSPPPFPNRAKYPFAATVRYRKLVIDIENLDGSIREGKDPNGKTWKTEFRGAHYGEIRGSKGTDGDALDVYIKNPPDKNANMVYIVHQNHPRTHPSKAGQFDEDKVILGVSSDKKAKALYLQHYNRKDFFRSITEMQIEPFKRYIFGENKADKVANAATAFLRMKLRGDVFAKGKKMNPKIAQLLTEAHQSVLAKNAACDTPGEKIHSQGRGRGLARGAGEGPIGGLGRGAGSGPFGRPFGFAEEEAEKEDKKDKKEKEAAANEFYQYGYSLGVQDKLAQLKLAAGDGTALTGAMAGAMPKGPTSKNIPGEGSPNWPTQMPQHGGPVTSIGDLKASMNKPTLMKKTPYLP